MIYYKYMSLLFGKKKQAEKTVLIVDVENGSVGVALARLSSAEAPKLFSQRRVQVSSLPVRDSALLARKVEKALVEVLSYAAEVAARVRLHPSAFEVGEISRIIFFLHAPWVAVNVTEPGKVSLDAQDDILFMLKQVVAAYFDGVPVSYQSFGSRIPSVVSGMFNTGDDVLFINITGEVMELAKARKGSLMGHATIPTGVHTFVRTLGVHSGMSEAEARSVLRLMKHTEAPSHASWGEAFHAAGNQLLEESRDVLGELLGTYSSAHGIYVVAPEPALGEWFARAITDDEGLSELFPEGSTARAVHPHHAKPFLGAHSQIPDIPLALEALSVDARMSGI